MIDQSTYHPRFQSACTVFLADKQYQTPTGLLFTCLVLLTLFLASLPGVSPAQEIAVGGVMDRPLTPNTGSPNAAPPAPGVLIALRQQQLQEIEQEKQELRQLSQEQLQQRADNGERAAMLILAEVFVDEANHQSLTIGAANAALSDAIRYYSLAARRGFPGAPAVDDLMPTLALRAIRSPRQ